MTRGIKRTHEQFVEEIKNETVDVIGQYVGNKEKIKLRCKKCGEVFNQLPYIILIRGTACPFCGRYRTTNKVLSDNGYWLSIDISTKTHKNAVMQIDAVDWNHILTLNLRRICAHKLGRKLYAIAIEKETRHTLYIHRLVLPEAKEIDHISDLNSGLDNRRSNLRSVTSSQNSMNTRISKNNKSGVTGVCWDNQHKKWMARIHANRKTIHLGFFKQKEDAITARKKAEIKYFGEYTYMS